MRFLLIAAIAIAGCTTGQARGVLESAGDAVRELAQYEVVPPQDAIALQTALDGAGTVLGDPESVDFWASAFLSTGAAVVGSLEAHDVEVPSWVSLAIKAVGALCHGMCSVFAGPSPDGGGVP